MKPQKEEILRWVAEQAGCGRTTVEILKNLGIPRSSYYRWKQGAQAIRRPSQSKRALTPLELERIDTVKARYPHLRHRRIQGILQGEGLYLSASSVYQRLKSQGKVEPYERRPSPLKKACYEVIGKNLMWGSDWTKFLIGDITWQLLTLIDFFSRLLIAWEILPSVNAASIKQIYQKALQAQNIDLKAAFKPELRVDQGSPNTSRVTQAFFETLGAQLSFARVRRPTDNAITERFYGSLKQEEIYLVRSYPDEASARDEIGRYVHSYNESRPHQSLFSFTPAYVHAINNKTKILNELKTLKRLTQEQRTNYWNSPSTESDLLNSAVLSH